MNDRLLLTINPKWKTGKWSKNKTLSMYTKDCSLKIGIEIKKVKMTNHFHRASAVCDLAKNLISCCSPRTATNQVNRTFLFLMKCLQSVQRKITFVMIRKNNANSSKIVYNNRIFMNS
jgi:hypothetical protein